MPLKKVPQKFNASIKEVVIGTGEKAVALGGGNVFPLYNFDTPLKNPPKIGIEVLDTGDAAEIVGRATKAAALPGASFISLALENADPNGKNVSVEDCVALAKKVADAVSLPLVIQGCKNVEKDSKLFEKIAEALQGKNILLLSAKEENHKAVAAAGVLAYNQKIGAESAVDLNLAKQLNVLIGQVGVKNESLVMNVGAAAAGYGFEYVVSTMDRVMAAALAQNDAQLQVPIVTPIAGEAWSVKEAVVSEEEYPEWGPVEERGVNMEVATAVSAIAAGSAAVILRHPKSVEAVSKFVNSLF
jgi:acetyl-CoA decarbonylase/synthase complex subunit delta